MVCRMKGNTMDDNEKKRLFNDDITHSYSDNANRISSEANVFLNQVFDYYVGKGFSPREIAYIVVQETMKEENRWINKVLREHMKNLTRK